MKPVRIMAVSGMLGYGFTEEAFRRGLDLGLDLIACDAGSADPGPYYLGNGSAVCVPLGDEARFRADGHCGYGVGRAGIHWFRRRQRL